MMTLHYHGTPITPVAALYELAGRCFCVSHGRPDDVRRCHEIGQSVMLDNGAFSTWQEVKSRNSAVFHEWAEPWLAYPTTWAVIPDCIDGGAEAQQLLIEQWPFGSRGAPVWHMDEPLERLLMLCDQWPKVCIGSTSVYADVLSEPWQRRMDSVFDELVQRHRFLPWLHMMRGMACAGERWPFASLDSTNIGRNHNRPQNTPRKMADQLDALQCPAVWRVEVGCQQSLDLK